MAKNIIIIDDDELFKAGLASLISAEKAFHVQNAISADEWSSLEISDTFFQEVDLIILDPPKPLSNGIALCEMLCQTAAQIPVMIFSNNYSKYMVMKSIENGVSAFFSKSILPEELIQLMHELTAEKSFATIKLEPKVRDSILEDQYVDFKLSAAEEEVLALVCKQKSSAEISADLGISVRTVESRKRSMMLKTKSKNMIGVILLFMTANQNQPKLERNEAERK